MRTYLRAIPFTFVVCLAAPPNAAPQQLITDLPVSLDRIRQELTKPLGTALKLDMPLQVPVATFKTRVEQRVFVPTLQDWLKKEFPMTEFQRQSAAWAANCCGIGLDPLFKSLERALQRRSVRKIREQIARELAELEVARKNANIPDK